MAPVTGETGFKYLASVEYKHMSSLLQVMNHCLHTNSNTTEVSLCGCLVWCDFTLNEGGSDMASFHWLLSEREVSCFCADRRMSRPFFKHVFMFTVHPHKQYIHKYNVLPPLTKYNTVKMETEERN